MTTTRQLRVLSAFAAGLALYVGSTVQPMPAEAADRAHTLIVGAVDSNPKKAIPRLEAMAGYLAGQLKGQGIEAGEAVVAADNNEMIRMLQAGEVDVLSDTAFSAIHFAAAGGAEIIMREWKKGVDEYKTVYMTRPDSGIKSLNDLVGKTVAMEEPGSTSGFLMPIAMLHQLNIKTVEIAAGAKAPADAVGYFFAGDEVNIATLVAKGEADAGATNSIAYDEFTAESAEIARNLTVFQSSEPIIRSTFMVRGALAPAVKDSIKSVLAAMDQDESAKDVLKTYSKVSKYDPITGSAAASIAHIRELYPLVQAEMKN